MTTATLPVYTKKDFQTDQEIRWCPGCGDYAILSAVQSVFPGTRHSAREFRDHFRHRLLEPLPVLHEYVRLPHDSRPRARHRHGPEDCRPDLEVWVATGDGDSLSIGGNHTIHMLRRNVGLKVLLFNNKIYGLTKGQFSPTSEIGKKTKSTPFGTTDRPFNPALARDRRGGHVRGAFGRRLPAAPEGHAEKSGGAQRLGLRRDSAELQHLQRRRVVRRSPKKTRAASTWCNWNTASR
jgi:hypothetical protein